MSFGNLPSSERPTPFRKTHLHFDLNWKGVSEPGFEFGRKGAQLFQGVDVRAHGLEYYEGWTVRSYHEDYAILHERTEVVAPLLPSAGTLVVASGFEEAKSFKAPQAGEMPNATVGASGNLALTGGTVIRKSVTAGNNWDSNLLSADQTAFPQPNATTNPYNVDATIKMDRVAYSLENDSAEKNIYLQFQVYGSVLTRSQELFRIYFNGPAGVNGDGTGMGIYALTIEGSGRCILFELCDDGNWQRRAIVFPGNGDSQLARNVVLHIVKSRVCALPESGTNGFIKFVWDSTGSMNKSGGGISAAVGALIGSNSQNLVNQFHKAEFHYRVPGPNTTPTHNRPLRLDMRRDLLGSFAMSWFKYPTTSITIKDSIFTLPFSPTDTSVAPFSLYWDICLPTGTTGTAKLKRADTDAELSIESSGSNYKVYTSPRGVAAFYVEYTIQSDGNLAPTIRNFRVVRDAVLRTPEDTQWEVGDSTHQKSVILSLEITGAERDITHESFKFSIADPLNKCSELKLRGGGTFKIETEYDGATTANRCVLGSGYLVRVEHERMPPDLKSGYPVEGWGHFSVHAKGEVARLVENFIDTPVPHMFNPLDGQPYKVTDFLKSIISRGGWETTEFDFPDLDIRIIPSNLDFSQSIDMLETIWDVVKSLARDYLSHFLIYDRNVGTRGKWRLVEVPTSPYTNVASFTFDAPASPPKLVHYLPSYPTSPPTAPVVGGTVKTWVTPPEANDIIVAGVGIFETDVPELMWIRLPNFSSFDVDDQNTADPSSPDYLGYRKPLYVIDPAIMAANSKEQSRAALNILAHRIYDLTAHAIKHMSFRAPLLLIPHESDASKVRPLRYYDPVLVDGVQFLVRNVNPYWTHDGEQYATYELEAPRI